jgi:hypothetical protein
MNNYELYLFAFIRTQCGDDLGIQRIQIAGNTHQESKFTALALGAYCAKNNLLLTRQQFDVIHPKFLQVVT